MSLFFKNYNTWDLNEQSFSNLKSFGEKVTFLTSYASLAPSSHNAQPWTVLISSNKVTFSPDYSRLVPVADKDKRFLYIGLGCFYKNFEVAASYFGFKITRKNIIKNNILTIEATLEETKIKNNKELFQSIPKRLTNRNPYTEKKISNKYLEEIKKITNKHEVSIEIITESDKKLKLIDITEKGDYIVWTDPKFQDEHLKWVRHSLTTKGDGMPAFTVGIPLPLSFFARTAIKKLPFAKMQAKKNRQLLNSTQYFVFLLTQKHNIETWEKVGEALEEIWLFASSKGLSLAPLAQIVEVEDLYKETMQVLNTKLRPQVFFRFGYASKSARHSPRRNVEEIIK